MDDDERPLVRLALLERRVDAVSLYAFAGLCLGLAALALLFRSGVLKNLDANG